MDIWWRGNVDVLLSVSEACELRHWRTHSGTDRPRPLSLFVLNVRHTGHPTHKIMQATGLADQLDALMDRLDLVARHAVPKGASRETTKGAVDCEKCALFTIRIA